MSQGLMFIADTPKHGNVDINAQFKVNDRYARHGRNRTEIHLPGEVSDTLCDTFVKGVEA